jgi:hypothetical protein
MKLLTILCLIVIFTTSCTSSNVVKNQDITTSTGFSKRCWELFIDTERRIGGSYRIYPEAVHPVQYCSTLKRNIVAGTEAQVLKQLKKGLAQVRNRGHFDFRMPKKRREGVVTIEEIKKS